METLLSHSFDYLSSHDGGKVRKGLRQLESLLAQICLSRPNATSENRRASVIGTGAGAAADSATDRRKGLAELRDDPAYLEFFKLQEGFEWNIAMRLIQTLERLLSRSSTGANDLLLVSTLDLLQGILLIHPPSRALFAREIYMNLLLDLLDPLSCPAIQSATVLVLVTALLEAPKNTRCFERLDGLLAITSVFKSGSTAREVKMKIVEFFYFYLMPEVPVSFGGNGNTGTQRRISSSRGTMDESKLDDARTSEEKQAYLGKYLSNVGDLVEDLRESEYGAAFP